MAMAERRDWWYHWQPRRLGDDQIATTCRWAPQMERWLTRGYEAMTFCTNTRICGYEYVQNVCPYHAQKRQTRPIVYAQHQHIAVGHPLMDGAALVIGDELPLSAFLHPWLIPAAHIVVADAARDLEQLLWTLRSLCMATAPEGGWSGPALLEALGGAEHVADIVDAHAHLTVDVDFVQPEIREPNEVDRLDYLHLPALLSLLGQEADAALGGSTDWVRRVHCTIDGLRLLMRRRPKTLPRHIIWCDATGDARLYERLLGMPVELVQPHVAMQGRVYQVHTSLNNRSAMGTSEDDRKIEQLRMQVEHIRLTRGYVSPAVITYKATRHLFDAEGHFGAERGTNRLASRDALIVIGTPQPPGSSIIETAAMVYDERIHAFDATWSTRDVPFDGTPYAYPVSGFWDDPDLQVLLQQAREAELLQTLHRARPLRRSVDIWLLSNLPLPGIQPQLLDVRELFGAPARVEPHRWIQMLQWAVRTVDSSGMIVSTDIAREFAITSTTARTYMYAMASQLHLTVTTAPHTGRGRPAMALIRQGKV